MTDTEEILERARAVPLMELPAFIGALAEASALAHARLLTPASTPTTKVTALDTLLDTADAAAALRVSVSWLYHRKDLPFVVRIPGCRNLKYSSNGIAKYLAEHNGGR